MEGVLTLGITGLKHQVLSEVSGAEALWSLLSEQQALRCLREAERVQVLSQVSPMDREERWMQRYDMCLRYNVLLPMWSTGVQLS